MSGKGKDVYLNGQLIGQYDSTGDYAADAKNLQEMLREKGLDRKIPRPVQMFHQALSFAKTAAYLHERDLRSVPTNPLSIAALYREQHVRNRTLFESVGALLSEKSLGARPSVSL